MKVLQISTYYLPNFGGIEQVAYDFSRILNTLGNEVRVVCFNTSKEDSCDDYENVKVYRIGFSIKIASQAISFSYLKKLRGIIEDYKPDVIHVHLPNPLIVFYLNIIKPKCKITVHWHSDIIRQKILKKFYLPIERRFLKKVSKIVATSNEYAKCSEILVNYSDKVIVIPNIVNTKYYSSLSDSEKIKIKDLRESYKNKKVIFTVGVHRLYKGISYLIDAAKYLTKDYEVIIAGSGPLTEQLKMQVKDLGLNNVVFLGRISDEEKRRYFYMADVFAFPSITKNEAFGIALAEALYCGLPAVTFTIQGSGVNWVNKDKETGLEVPEINAKKYAEALMSVSKSEYGKASKDWIRQNFTEEAVTPLVQKLFNDED